MRAYVSPILLTLEGLASLSSVFFFVNGGILYMTSSGKPEKPVNAYTPESLQFVLLDMIGADSWKLSKECPDYVQTLIDYNYSTGLDKLDELSELVDTRLKSKIINRSYIF
jgi:hypothetical protein